MLYSDNIRTSKKFKSVYSVERFERKKKKKIITNYQQWALDKLSNEKLNRSIFQTLTNEQKIYENDYEKYDPIEDFNAAEIQQVFIAPHNRKRLFEYDRTYEVKIGVISYQILSIFANWSEKTLESSLQIYLNSQKNFNMEEYKKIKNLRQLIPIEAIKKKKNVPII
ncbi:hypothetical protein M0813_09047 [Anaeramoeba flamelloides]|uniref:Uncharacterized protein n=1 Tax=Anaeramoeba flamelloides TaxID=1746091 RepID=A0ABQ8X6D6_9EUKA|nr:hypothetical protein M0813_09047 [Anaeramoeba flamelloides]